MFVEFLNRLLKIFSTPSKKIIKQKSDCKGEKVTDSNKLTENFKLSEFKCKDGTDVPEDLMENVKLLCENLQVLRDHIGKPIRVISGYRSPKYNRRIGGAKRSQHMCDVPVRYM